MSGRRAPRPEPEAPAGGLPAALRADFDAWLEAAVARFAPPLALRDVRKGVRSLSSLYVERRAEGGLAERAVAGPARRAAFATYYAALHWLAAHAAARAAGLEHSGGARRLVDAGCGTGAAGAAVARALPAPPRVLGIDRSGWALGEARHTYRAFGLAARTRRGALPAALPRAGEGDLLVLGWVANECGAAAREALLARVDAALALGARLLLLEPLAGGAAPWWRDWAEALAPRGVREGETRLRPELPRWVAELDRAAGLDHTELGARVLAGPGR